MIILSYTAKPYNPPEDIPLSHAATKQWENGFVRLTDYPVTDLIMGAEKQAFSPIMQQLITDYCRRGGNILVSGSYIGSNMNSPSALGFTENILKYSFGGSMGGKTSGTIYGANTHFTIPCTVNEKTYAVPAPDCLTPVAPAYSTFIYTPGNYSAGIAYKGITALSYWASLSKASKECSNGHG